MKYDTTCFIFLLKNMIPNWRREGERADWIMLMRGKRRDNIYFLFIEVHSPQKKGDVNL